MTRVLVHIDRLVLKGFAHADRHALAEGLRAELTRQLAEPETPARIGAFSDLGTVDIGRVLIRHGATAASIGSDTAQRIGKVIRS